MDEKTFANQEIELVPRPTRYSEVDQALRDELIEGLAEMQKRHREEQQFYIDRLAEIEARYPQEMMIVPKMGESE